MSVNYECNTVETLKQHIKQNTIVVVKLGAKWCSPCKIIAPKFVETGDNVHRHLRKFHEEGMENLPTCSFISIDVDDICFDTGGKWGDQLQCGGVPMFIVFFNGKTEDTFSGADMTPVNACIENAIQQSLQTTAV
jgi:thiol-disulfide isomerase/thioredoxin